MKGLVQLRYLTDAAFEITTDDGVVVVDLGEFTPAQMLSPGIVAAVSSHQHTDHCDRAKLAALGVPVWAPADTVVLLEGDGIEEAQPLVAGFPVPITSSLNVTAMPVSHGPEAKPILNYGLIIEVNGWRIWHSGDLGADTEPRPTGVFDLVLIGIGGTYVFDAEQAAAYLTSLGHTANAIGMHWDYAAEMGPRFVGAGADAAWTPLLLAPGEVYVLGGGA